MMDVVSVFAVNNAGLEIAANKNNGFFQTSSVLSRFLALLVFLRETALFLLSLRLSFGATFIFIFWCNSSAAYG